MRAGFNLGDKVLCEEDRVVSWEGTIDQIKYEDLGRIKSYCVINKSGSRWFFHDDYELTLVKD